MNKSNTGWSAFGAYSLNGELPSERALLELESRITKLRASMDISKVDHADELSRLEQEQESLSRLFYSNLRPWETVQIARHPDRPLVGDYTHLIVHEFCELHGDRVFGDDPAILTGFGFVGGHRVLIVGHQRGREVKDRVACNFGCAHPEGYRKALHKMKLAAKFQIPIVTLIDTPGAYPGLGAEERGIASAIAMNLAAMPMLRVPIVTIVIGEGGSGGALGIGVADRTAMLENSIFSVISPEGCAAILWKTGKNAREAAEALKLRARDLLQLGLIDEIIAEPLGGAHRNPAATALGVERFITTTLTHLKSIPLDMLLSMRYQRLRSLGSQFQFSPEELRQNLTVPTLEEAQCRAAS